MMKTHSVVCLNKCSLSFLFGKALPIQMGIELVWQDPRLVELYTLQANRVKSLLNDSNESIVFRLLFENQNSLPVWMPNVQINSFVQMPLQRKSQNVVLTNNANVHLIDR